MKKFNVYGHASFSVWADEIEANDLGLNELDTERIDLLEVGEGLVDSSDRRWERVQ